MPEARFLYRHNNYNVHCEVEGCNYSCVRQSQLRAHCFALHECPNCGGTFLRRWEHEPCNAPPQRNVIQVGGAIDGGPFRLHVSAHHRHLLDFRNEDVEGIIELTDLFEHVRVPTFNLVSQVLQRYRGIKIEFNARVQLERDGEHKDTDLRSNSSTLLHMNLLPVIYRSSLQHQESVLELFTVAGSGWKVVGYHYFEVCFSRYDPLRPRGYIPTPANFGRVGLLNIENKNDYCFYYCIMAHLWPIEGDNDRKKNPIHYERIMADANERTRVLNVSTISFPVAIQDFSAFEFDNKLSLNIYSYEVDENQDNHRRRLGRRGNLVIYPVVLTKTKEYSRDRHINLLILTSGARSHYVLITNLSAFLGNDDNKYDLCRFCLNKRFVTRPVTVVNENGVERRQTIVDYSALDRHEARCRVVNKSRIIFPEEDCIRFKDLKQTLAVPYICFADLEAFMTQIDRSGQMQHDPCSYGYIVCSDSDVESVKLYDGENPVKDLIENLLFEADEAIRKNQHVAPLEMTDRDWKIHRSSYKCKFCRHFYGPSNYKVKHHAHVDCIYLAKRYKAGQYICTLCNNCNMQIKFKKELYCLFHNGRKYDMKMIIESMGPEYRDRVDILAKNKEQFISIIIDGKLRITDSIQHLVGSLDSLVTNLRLASIDKFKCTRRVFSAFAPYLPDLVRKQPFPYSYCTGRFVWDEKQLPPIEAFYNDLKDEACSAADYKHAMDIWKNMGCKTFRDYCRIYLMLDVTLLADVYLDYRRTCMEELIIDPTYSITSSGYSFQAFLYLSKVNIEYIKDQEIYNLLTTGLKGGVTVSATRLVTTNLPEVEGFDSSKKKCEILFTDCNAMYPGCMAKPMPVGGFRMLTAEELATFDVMNIDDSKGKGYIIECDVAYDDALHTAHAFFPMMPEKYRVTTAALSDYQKSQLNFVHHQDQYAAERLLLTLFDKDNYICYHKLLRFYCSKGIRIKKYHKVLEFKETCYMKAYVEKISNLRKNATCEIIGFFWKILLNSIYGYCLRNKANDKIVKLCFEAESCEKFSAAHNFLSRIVIHDDLSIFQFAPTSVFFTQPYTTGFCITELARLELYSFYYDVLSVHFNNRLTLCMMDTDSVQVSVELEDDKTLAQELEEIKEHFDFSDLDPRSPHIQLKSSKNASVPGKWKLEKKGRRIRQTASLKVKQYSMLFDGDWDGWFEVIKGRGVPRHILKRLTHGQYLEVLRGGNPIRTSSKYIVSKKLRLLTVGVDKLSVHAFTASRYILPDGINTLPFGHKDLRSITVEAN